MATVSRVGVALDLMDRALEVGDVGMRVAADTWLRWMNLAGRLALVSVGQGVATLRGLEVTASLKDAFDDYIAEMADLPGKAGKTFELEWEAARNQPREAEFEALLVPDVPYWQAWTRLADKFAQLSTAWQRNRGRLDRRYAPQLRRIAGMPLQASRDLADALRRLGATIRRRSEPTEASVRVTLPRGGGAEQVVKLRADDVIDELVSMAGKPTTPEHELTNAVAQYAEVIADATNLAVAMGREYDRQANRYGMALGLSQSWARDQAEVDERLGQFLEAKRQRVTADGYRSTDRDVDQLLQASERELRELARWPVRTAQESNAIFDQMIRLKRRRSRTPPE